MRLTRIVLNLCPDEPEVEGLLALMQLHHARSGARLNAAGEMVTLEHQDRGLWDEVAIAEGQLLLEAALGRGNPGPYQLQAAIAAVHVIAPSLEQTDWAQIALLYEGLLAIQPNPVVDLNRIVAISYSKGAETALSLLTPLAETLDGYQPFHAAHADILRRSGDKDGAGRAYDRAIEMSENAAEMQLLRRRRDTMLAD